MSLDNWNQIFNIEVNHLAQYRLSSLTWSLNRFSAPLIVVASDDVNAPSNSKLYTFRFNLTNHNFNLINPTQIHDKKFDFVDQVSYVSFGPSAGLTHHRLAVANGARISIFTIEMVADEETNPTRYAHPSNSEENEGHFTTRLISTLEAGMSQVRLKTLNSDLNSF